MARLSPKLDPKPGSPVSLATSHGPSPCETRGPKNAAQATATRNTVEERTANAPKGKEMCPLRLFHYTTSPAARKMDCLTFRRMGSPIRAVEWESPGRQFNTRTQGTEPFRDTLGDRVHPGTPRPVATGWTMGAALDHPIALFQAHLYCHTPCNAAYFLRCLSKNLAISL